MSRKSAVRAFLALAALISLAACVAPTAPTPSKLRAPITRQNDGTPGDTTGRSGWPVGH